jgi:hypothetical protein
MDIKTPHAQTLITTPVAYQRTVQTLQRTSLPTSPISSDDIIDCVEINTERHSLINTQISLYEPLDKHPLNSKGTLIDIWI